MDYMYIYIYIYFYYHFFNTRFYYNCRFNARSYFERALVLIDVNVGK